MPRLRRSDCSNPGLRRHGRGRGFAYRNIRPTRTARERAIKAVIKEVAEQLGNTPAVARRAYIDPRVFDRFRSGWGLQLPALDFDDPFGAGHDRRRLERAVLELLG